jgi:8-oxo-dGTP pyrophosphatase MutT (NUDIX family)
VSAGPRPGATDVTGVTDLPEHWEVTGGEEHFSGHIVHVRTDRVRMPDAGEIIEREVVGHPGSVAVLALDDDDRVLLLRQYRHPVAHRLWELPAGLRDVDGEPLLTTAQRELAEETGYRARIWHTLVDVFSSPGMTNERVRVFLARGLSAIPEGESTFERVHEEADMPLAWVPLEQAVTAVGRGDIHNALAVMGILSVYTVRAAGYRGLRPPDAPEG